MMVLYRLSDYKAVKVDNEYNAKYQSSRQNEYEKDLTHNFNRGLGPQFFMEQNYLKEFKEDNLRNIPVKFGKNPVSSFWGVF